MTRYKKGKDGYYHTSIKTPGGRWRHISAKTVAELEAKKAETVAAPLVSSITLRDYALRWFATYMANRAYKTREMYARIIDKFICDDDIGIGGVAMKDLRPMTVQEFLLRIRASSCEHAMRRTCEQAIITLRQIEKAAIRDGVISQQYTYGLKLEREPKLKRRALTEQEEAAVFAAELPPREKSALMLLYGCGLRRGELLALKPADIDLEARKLTVSRGVVFAGNRPIVQPTPKTASGVRTVPVPRSVAAAISGYLADAKGRTWLFPGKGPAPMTLGAWRYMWDKIRGAMQAAGAPCEGLTPHCFRHNYATKCYYSDITPLMAARLMGHADATMITEVYAHLREEAESAAAKLDLAFEAPDRQEALRIVR